MHVVTVALMDPRPVQSRDDPTLHRQDTLSREYNWLDMLGQEIGSGRRIEVN
jgi:hypothetical protein